MPKVFGFGFQMRTVTIPIVGSYVILRHALV